MSQITFGSCHVVTFDPLFSNLNLPRVKSQEACSPKSILKVRTRTPSQEDCTVPLKPGVRGLNQDFFYREAFAIETKEGIIERLKESFAHDSDADVALEGFCDGSGDFVFAPSQAKSVDLLQAELEGIESEDGFTSYDAMFDFRNDDYYVDGGELICVDYDFM